MSKMTSNTTAAPMQIAPRTDSGSSDDPELLGASTGPRRRITARRGCTGARGRRAGTRPTAVVGTPVVVLVLTLGAEIVSGAVVVVVVLVGGSVVANFRLWKLATLIVP